MGLEGTGGGEVPPNGGGPQSYPRVPPRGRSRSRHGAPTQAPSAADVPRQPEHHRRRVYGPPHASWIPRQPQPSPRQPSTAPTEPPAPPPLPPGRPGRPADVRAEPGVQVAAPQAGPALPHGCRPTAQGPITQPDIMTVLRSSPRVAPRSSTTTFSNDIERHSLPDGCLGPESSPPPGGGGDRGVFTGGPGGKVPLHMAAPKDAADDATLKLVSTDRKHAIQVRAQTP